MSLYKYSYLSNIKRHKIRVHTPITKINQNKRKKNPVKTKFLTGRQQKQTPDKNNTRL